jgi:CheY-like chemotaxis protein
MDGHTILIVGSSEERTLREFESLRRAGNQIVHAGFEPHALSVVASQAIDLVLIDLRARDIDGFQVLDALRATSAGSQLSIIAIVDELLPLDQQRLLHADFTDYLFAPVDQRRLLHFLTPYFPHRSSRDSTPDDQGQ